MRCHTCGFLCSVDACWRVALLCFFWFRYIFYFVLVFLFHPANRLVIFVVMWRCWPLLLLLSSGGASSSLWPMCWRWIGVAMVLFCGTGCYRNSYRMYTWCPVAPFFINFCISSLLLRLNGHWNEWRMWYWVDDEVWGYSMYLIDVIFPTTGSSHHLVS